MTGERRSSPTSEVSVEVDGCEVRGTIVALHPRHIRVRIDAPFEGFTQELNIGLLGGRRPPEGYFAHDGAITDYGAETARRLLEELYGQCLWYQAHSEGLRERYLRHLRRLATLERLGMPDAKSTEVRRRLVTQLRSEKITGGEYQRSLYGLKQTSRVHGCAELLLRDSFWEEAGLPKGILQREDMLRHFLGLDSKDAAERCPPEIRERIDKVFVDHREECLQGRKTWKPRCYCLPGQDQCGGDCTCGAPAHQQHFPGPLPFTAAWCDDCSWDIAFLVSKMGVEIPWEYYQAAAVRRRKKERE
jgi:hypothetical protein